VAAGDNIQFVENEVTWADCDTTTWDPQVDYSAAGTGTPPTFLSGATPGTTFLASQGYSNTQGQNQWSYQSSMDNEATIQNMTYDSGSNEWRTPAAPRGLGGYCVVASNWQYPATTQSGNGPGCDVIRTWVAPSNGTVLLTANGLGTLAPACNGNPGGVQIRVLKNGAPFWPGSGWQAIEHGSAFSFPTLTLNLAAGDQLQFVVAHTGTRDDCDTTTWDPQITYLESWQETSTTTYDSDGNPLTTTDPDANAGDSTHVGCTVTGNTTK
jgi:hypothetical protein